MRGGRKVTPQLKHYTIIARAVEEGAAMGWGGGGAENRKGEGGGGGGGGFAGGEGASGSRTPPESCPQSFARQCPR